MAGPYSLTSPVNSLPLVGIKYAQKLEKLGISTVKDLIHHYPFRYSDTREIDSISDLLRKGEGTIEAVVDTISNTRTRGKKWLTKASLSDFSGHIYAVWFNQPYLTKTLKKGERFLFNGKISSKWGTNLSNPQYEKVDNMGIEEDTTHLGKLTPVYPETYGISSKWLRARIKPLRKYIPELADDFIPSQIREKEKLTALSEAIEKIHFPESLDDIKIARNRLGLNELIEIQIQAQKHLKKRQKLQSVKINHLTKDQNIKQLLDSLKFQLTTAQENALEEIVEDISKDKPMHRLLNGDVGSGKTIVALSAAVAAYSAGYTTVIMAPTTILAQQHFKTISQIINSAKLKIPINLITSDNKDLPTDKPQILIGTHALIYQETLPSNTALVVIDEQHRFGVAQRELLNKLTSQISDLSSRQISPHYLTMTATPIPRSLTLVLYGHTDVSVLDEMPEGRKPVKTHLVPQQKRNDSYKWIADKIQAGEQAFVVCPLIEDSEKIEAKAAKEEFNRLQKQIFPDFKLGLLHGQLKEKEKNQILADFKDKNFNILVTTPVVEVGIDIPNATVMIIENAERFGLAQLHQFRGRIGRGSKQSFCFLFTNSKKEDTLERLKFFSKNSSGFKVAEYDLKSRGPGEVYGLRQSGLLNLRFADISNLQQIKRAKRIAEQIV